MATTESNGKTVRRESHTDSIEETAALVLRQHIRDLGLGTTVTPDYGSIFVWNESGETIAHVRIVADDNEMDFSQNTDVVTRVSGDDRNAVTGWSFETPNGSHDSKAGLAHYLVDVAS